MSTCYYFEFSQNGKILIARYPRTTIAKLHLRGTADASMSALGHRRTFAVHSRMSALPPLVDERRQPISFYKITSVAYEKISHSAKGKKSAGVNSGVNKSKVRKESPANTKRDRATGFKNFWWHQIPACNFKNRSTSVCRGRVRLPQGNSHEGAACERFRNMAPSVEALRLKHRFSYWLSCNHLGTFNSNSTGWSVQRHAVSGGRNGFWSVSL